LILYSIQENSHIYKDKKERKEGITPDSVRPFYFGLLEAQDDNCKACGSIKDDQGKNNKFKKIPERQRNAAQNAWLIMAKVGT